MAGAANEESFGRSPRQLGVAVGGAPARRPTSGREARSALEARRPSRQAREERLSVQSGCSFTFAVSARTERRGATTVSPCSATSLGIPNVVQRRPLMNLPETSTFSHKLNSSIEAVKAHPVALGVIATLAAMAVANRYLARKAERENPPIGRFVTVNGVRLHYLDQGSGTPLVLLHGNGSMIQDFQSSGLIDLAAKKYRVIAFDRPGYGHSDRPRTTIWTPEAQANLINAALEKIGVAGAVVLGHSWGTLVAVALALNHQQRVQSLILASGYYYPTVRVDAVVLSAPSIPVLGDIVRYTISPVLSRLMWPLMVQKLFGPKSVPKKFNGFPKEMAVRPSQIRAGAAEAALMIPTVHGLQGEYSKLRIPVAILAGSDDRLIDPDQSVRLHHDISRSTLKCVAGNGHMIHQTATAQIMSAIDSVAGHNRPLEVSNVA